MPDLCCTCAWKHNGCILDRSTTVTHCREYDMNDILKEEHHSPDHYRKGGHECIDICRAVLGDEAFVSGCRMIMLQYLWRLGEKDESVKEARKIETYARWMKETLEGKPLSK